MGRDGVGGARADQAAAAAALSRQLQRLYVAVGEPSPRDLEALARLRGIGLSHGSVRNVLSGRRVRATTVEAFIGTCLSYAETHRPRMVLDRDLGDRGRWNELKVAARIAIEGVSPPPGLLGRPVGEWSDPFALQVHRAITATGHPTASDPLPVYVPRDHDLRLGEVVAAAVGGRSQLVVLVGESSTGKTRALWEAVQTLPDEHHPALSEAGRGWRLWRPRADLDPQRLVAGLRGGEADDGGARLGPRTVVWLNELQNYLPTAEACQQVGAAIRDAVSDPRLAPLLVVGTLWRTHLQEVTPPPPASGPDLHAVLRELLTQPHIVPVDTRFVTSDEVKAAAAQRDPRWREALEHAPDQPTQYMAGGLELVRRYPMLPETQRAVIDAAADARRLGLPLALPVEFLKAAVGAYLVTPLSRMERSTWFVTALAALDQPTKGAPGAITPAQESDKPNHIDHAGEPGQATNVESSGEWVQLHDYLEQHLRRIRRLTAPPDAFWDAALTLSAPPVVAALALAASDRGRLAHSDRLYRHAAHLGESRAWTSLATLRDRAGDSAGAEAAAAAAGDSDAWTELALKRAGSGHPGQDRAWQEAAAAGDSSAWTMLATLRERAGDCAGAEKAAAAAAAAGNSNAWAWLAEMRERAGDRAGAEHAWQAAASGGNKDAWASLALQREYAEDRAGADEAAAAAAAAGYDFAWTILARTRQVAGDRAGAEHAWQAAAAAGANRAWASLAALREQAGDRAGAEEAAAAEAAAGEVGAWAWLAELRERSGDRAGAEQAWQAVATVGDTKGLARLAELREQAGDRAGAEEAAAATAAAGDARAWVQLASTREVAGDRAGAEQAWQAAAAAGNSHAWTRLAELRERAGDRAGAEEAAGAAAAAAGDARAWVRLGELREDAGLCLGAEHAWQAAATAGDTEGMTRLAQLREAAGDRAGAERAAASNSNAWIGLALARQTAGDREGAEQAWQAAATAGNSHAWTRLAELREQAGDRVGAEQAAAAAAAAGDHAWTVKAPAANSNAWTRLAELREQAGDRVGAEHAWQAAAAAGYDDGWTRLALLREAAGDHAGAEHAAAATGGHTSAWTRLARCREAAGDHVGAVRAAQAAADAGQFWAVRNLLV